MVKCRDCGVEFSEGCPIKPGWQNSYADDVCTMSLAQLYEGCYANGTLFGLIELVNYEQTPCTECPIRLQCMTVPINFTAKHRSSSEGQ